MDRYADRIASRQVSGRCKLVAFSAFFLKQYFEARWTLPALYFLCASDRPVTSNLTAKCYYHQVLRKGAWKKLSPQHLCFDANMIHGLRLFSGSVVWFNLKEVKGCFARSEGDICRFF